MFPLSNADRFRGLLYFDKGLEEGTTKEVVGVVEDVQFLLVS
jgi:hypothetical protein